MPEEDFDIDSLAAYLHLSPQQVERLANRGKLPGRKVSGQWRFAAAEIHHWMEQRMGLLDDEELAQVEGMLERAWRPGDPATISIAALLPVEAIAIPLAARTRSKVITAMAELAAGTGMLWDPAAMAEAVRAREDMQPTAMENGVALLHPRRPMPGILAEPMIALGIVKGGVPFGGAGGALTDIFFLICSVNDRGHLRTLARLARLISDADFLAGLRAAPDAAVARQLIVAREQVLAG